ncbi:MAG: integrin alpha, partial [Solirubrobacteraceae bacterium]
FGNLGQSVAGAGDLDSDGYADLVVGAPGITSSSGSACVQYGGPTGIASATLATCTTRLNSAYAFSRFGWDVAAAGDTNGDGYADLAVGAPGYTAFSGGEGAVFVWRGGATRIASGGIETATDSITGLQAAGGIGESVSGLGDMNGDGYADLALGASQYNGVGAAFVFIGGPFGLGIQYEIGAFARLDPVIEVAGFDQAYFGASVSGGGDANGDGFGDLVVGAPYQDHGFPLPVGDRGRALVFFGGGAGIQTERLPFTTIDFPQNPVTAHAAERFGFDVAPAGDVNGDGRADLVVSAFGFDGGQSGEGAAIVYMGGTTAARVFQTDQVGAQVSSARAAGDVNGDGYGDLIVGSASYDSGA